MSPRVDLDIWMALRTRCLQFPSEVRPALLFPGDPLGSQSSRHIRVTEITAPPLRLVVDDDGPKIRRGTLQLIYCVPVEEVNYEATKAHAGLWAHHFRQGTRLRYANLCVKVDEQPEVGEGFREDGWWKTPIRIRWETAA